MVKASSYLSICQTTRLFKVLRQILNTQTILQISGMPQINTKKQTCSNTALILSDLNQPDCIDSTNQKYELTLTIDKQELRELTLITLSRKSKGTAIRNCQCSSRFTSSNNPRRKQSKHKNKVAGSIQTNTENEALKGQSELQDLSPLSFADSDERSEQVTNSLAQHINQRQQAPQFKPASSLYTINQQDAQAKLKSQIYFNSCYLTHEQYLQILSELTFLADISCVAQDQSVNQYTWLNLNAFLSDKIWVNLPKSERELYELCCNVIRMPFNYQATCLTTISTESDPLTAQILNLCNMQTEQDCQNAQQTWIDIISLYGEPEHFPWPQELDSEDEEQGENQASLIFTHDDMWFNQDLDNQTLSTATALTDSNDHYQDNEPSVNAHTEPIAKIKSEQQASKVGASTGRVELLRTIKKAELWLNVYEQLARNLQIQYCSQKTIWPLHAKLMLRMIENCKHLAYLLQGSVEFEQKAITLGYQLILDCNNFPELASAISDSEKQRLYVLLFNAERPWLLDSLNISNQEQALSTNKLVKETRQVDNEADYEFTVDGFMQDQTDGYENAPEPYAKDLLQTESFAQEQTNQNLRANADKLVSAEFKQDFVQRVDLFWQRFTLLAPSWQKILFSGTASLLRSTDQSNKAQDKPKAKPSQENSGSHTQE